MAAVSLSNCPNEMQLACMEWLPLPDLAAISMTNQHLRQLAQPQVYTHIRLEWTSDPHPPILLLLRTLLENPGLRRHVRSLILQGQRTRTEGGHGADSAEISDSLPGTVALPLPELSEAVMQTGAPQGVAHIWNIKTRLGVVDAVVALLVSMFPNLELLSMECGWTIETHYLGHLFRTALCTKRRDGLPRQPPTFKALKHVALAPSETMDEHTDDHNSADLLALLYLPNIISLSASIDNPIRFAWPYKHAPSPSTLTSLALHRIRECRLEPVLSRLRNLQSLQYNWFYQADVDREVSQQMVDLDVMATAIAGCKGLTDLEITALALPSYRLGEFDPPIVALHGTLAKLSELPQLRRVSLPWVFLAGVSDPDAADGIGHVLPRGLELLKVRGDLEGQSQDEWEGERMISTMESELESGSLSSLKRLETICLPGFIVTEGVLRVCKAELKRVSKRFKVRLMIVSCQKENDDWLFNIG